MRTGPPPPTGNYMYLQAKPLHNSLLSVPGPRPWYIATTAVVGLVMLVVLQLAADWARRHDTGPVVADFPAVAQCRRESAARS